MMGIRIAALRRATGLSQTELADKLQISSSTVGMYEQGRREPPVTVLTDMADCFRVSLDFLIRGTPGIEEGERLEALILDRVEVMDTRLDCRCNRPFSRQELAVLFAALLMGA